MIVRILVGILATACFIYSYYVLITSGYEYTHSAGALPLSWVIIRFIKFFVSLFISVALFFLLYKGMIPRDSYFIEQFQRLING